MGTEANWRRLLAAFLLRAARDAVSEDPDLAAAARHWLVEEGATWAVWLDLDPREVTAWVGDLPVLPWEQLILAL